MHQVINLHRERSFQDVINDVMEEIARLEGDIRAPEQLVVRLGINSGTYRELSPTRIYRSFGEAAFKDLAGHLRDRNRYLYHMEQFYLARDLRKAVLSGKAVTLESIEARPERTLEQWRRAFFQIMREETGEYLPREGDVDSLVRYLVEVPRHRDGEAKALRNGFVLLETFRLGGAIEGSNSPADSERRMTFLRILQSILGLAAALDSEKLLRRILTIMSSHRTAFMGRGPDNLLFNRMIHYCKAQILCCRPDHTFAKKDYEQLAAIMEDAVYGSGEGVRERGISEDYPDLMDGWPNAHFQRLAASTRFVRSVPKFDTILDDFDGVAEGVMKLNSTLYSHRLFPQARKGGVNGQPFVAEILALRILMPDEEKRAVRYGVRRGLYDRSRKLLAACSHLDSGLAGLDESNRGLDSIRANLYYRKAVLLLSKYQFRWNEGGRAEYREAKKNSTRLLSRLGKLDRISKLRALEADAGYSCDPEEDTILTQ